MDEEKQEQASNGIGKQLKEGAKKQAKDSLKNKVFKSWTTKLKFYLLLIVIGIGLIIGLYAFLMDLIEHNQSKTSREASASAISYNFTTKTQTDDKDEDEDEDEPSSTIEVNINSDKGRYELSYKFLDDDGNERNKEEVLEEIKEKLEDEKMDISNLSESELYAIGILMEKGLQIDKYNAEELKCLVLCLKADIASNNFDLRPKDEIGKEVSEADMYGDEIYGTLQVHKTKVIEDDKGNIIYEEIPLECLPYEEFEEKIEADDLEQFVGKTINGAIDWNNRITLARHHSATHLIIASAREVLGDYIWQAGSQNGLKRARIDLSHYDRISQEELNEIERRANAYVMDNIEFDINFHTRDEAQELYGFKLYQGGIVPGKMIRVVKIPGVNVQACAGTHLSNTGEIGPIKINKTERVQDGVERIDFSAGLAAVESIQNENKLLQESSQTFKVEASQLPKTCDRFFNEWKAQKNEIDRLKSQIASLKMNSLADDYDEINGLKVVSELMEADFKELQKIATDFTDNGKADVVIIGNTEGKIVGAASQNAIDNGIKINNVIKSAASILGGGGGGRLSLAQGAGKNTDKMDEAIQTAIGIIKG